LVVHSPSPDDDAPARELVPDVPPEPSATERSFRPTRLLHAAAVKIDKPAIMEIAVVLSVGVRILLPVSTTKSVLSQTATA
jgi:hypothetical protein